jgi:hypothetical protein
LQTICSSRSVPVPLCSSPAYTMFFHRPFVPSAVTENALPQTPQLSSVRASLHTLNTQRGLWKGISRRSVRSLAAEEHSRAAKKSVAGDQWERRTAQNSGSLCCNASSDHVHHHSNRIFVGSRGAKLAVSLHTEVVRRERERAYERAVESREPRARAKVSRSGGIIDDWVKAR